LCAYRFKNASIAKTFVNGWLTLSHERDLKLRRNKLGITKKFKTLQNLHLA